MAFGAGKAIPELDAADEARLAAWFAPVFVYHPAEEYLPSSPLFPIEMGTRGEEGSVAIRLGTPDSRREAYRALSPAEKAGIATVYYRAYPAVDSGDEVMVLEYWLYYVQNQYLLKANVLPLWYDGSHPNDLEHIHIVLAPLAGTPNADDVASRFAVREVFSSAHEGYMPANRYRFDGDRGTGPIRFLVELGSHALAPDLDGDGVFTPGPDGDSGYKLTWGIRDTGALWTRYSPGYMDPRPEGQAIVLGPPSQPSQGAGTYRLVAVDVLEDDIARIGLDEGQIEDAFESDVHWFRRIFGASNGSASSLLVPPRARVGSEWVGIRNPSSGERGFLAGGFGGASPGFSWAAGTRS